MGGALAAFAEVIDAAHNAFAKEFLPETIHRDARRQRIAAVGDPFSELEAAALAGRYRGELVPRGDAQGAARDDGSGGVGIAAHVDRHVVRLRIVLHGEGLGRLRFEELGVLDFAPFGFQERGDFISTLRQRVFFRGRFRGGSGGNGCGFRGWRGRFGWVGFLEGGEFGDDGLVFFGQLSLFRFHRGELGGVIGFGLLSLGDLGRGFRQRHAADGAPHAEADHLTGRGRTTQHPGHAVVVL